MATMKNGLWGGFTGKIGNVVGVTRNGAYYVRSLPAHVKDPGSKKQVTQRSRFSITLAFLKTFTPLLRIGFQTDADGMKSAFNAAMSYNVQHAVKGETGDFEIDYQNVLVSKGPLPASPVLQASVSGGALLVRWDDARDALAMQDDQVMLLACNAEKKLAVFDLHAGKRGSLVSQLLLPSQWHGDSVETYIAFMSADATRVSESRYAGRHQVVV